MGIKSVAISHYELLSFYKKVNHAELLDILKIDNSTFMKYLKTGIMPKKQLETLFVHYGVAAKGINEVMYEELHGVRGKNVGKRNQRT